MIDRHLIPPSWICLFLLSAALPAADGAFDETFSNDGRVTVNWSATAWARAQAVAAFPDGSMLVGGTVQEANTAPLNFGVVRFRANGTADSSWGFVGSRLVTITELAPVIDNRLLRIVLDSTGRAVLLGALATGDLSERVPILARLTAGGDLDTSFGDEGLQVVTRIPSDRISTRGAIAHGDGFVFTGWCACPDPGGSIFTVRTDAEGVVDTSFGVNGWAFWSVGTDPLLPAQPATQPDGRIVVPWMRDFRILSLTRLMPTGAPDSSFGPGGTTETLLPIDWIPSGVAIDPVDGAVYVALRDGDEDPLSGSVARFTTDGDLDTGFGYPDLDLEEGSDVSAIAVTGDGKIVAAGTIDANGDQLGGFFAARLLATGAFDPTFDGNGVNRMEIDLYENAADGGAALTLSGGKPILVGFATRPGGQTSFAAMRLENASVHLSTFESGSLHDWSSSHP